jgi:hypothetical protein
MDEIEIVCKILFEVFLQLPYIDILKMDITLIKSYLVNGNKKDLLHAAILVEGVITFAFVISSFVVAGTANAGFNCVLTGFLNIAFIAGSYYVIENSKAPIAVYHINYFEYFLFSNNITTFRLDF